MLDLDSAVLQDHAEDVLVALQAVVVHGGAVARDGGARWVPAGAWPQEACRAP